MENITIGYCTNKQDDDFKSYLKENFGEDCEVIEKISNSEKPIAVCYNEILSASSNNIVLLVHNDITFEQKEKYPLPLNEIFPKLFEATNFGIIGIIGGTKITTKWPRWSNGIQFGHLIQGYKYRHQKDKYDNKGIGGEFKLQITQMLTVDGVFLAINKSRIKSNFDETNRSFHHYDIDFCLSNVTKGVMIGATKAFLIRHASEGNRDEIHNQYLNSFFLPKWESKFPLDLKNLSFNKPLSKVNICIVNYNTNRLTNCLIKSIKKHVPNPYIYVFDNSDKEVFSTNDENVHIFDNTKGNIIDFEKWLSTYPNKNRSVGKVNGWASAKHTYTIEKCIELIDDDFILLDSDVLLKRDISDLIDRNCIFVGEIGKQGNNKKRVYPFICYINAKMCKEKGVHFFDENYMHGLRKTLQGDMYDSGGGFLINAEKYPHKEIMSNKYIVHLKGGSWTNKHNENLTTEEWLKQYKHLWSMENNKKVIYTCITGNYDSLVDPVKITDGFDYVCFTDNEELTSNIWEIRQLPEEVKDLSQVKKQRCIKINPHKFLSEYDLSIWVDGSVEIIDDVNEFVDTYLTDDINIYIPQHPARKCTYKEAEVCIKLNKDTKTNIQPQVDGYKKEGLPVNYGMVQSNIILRRHNSPDCIKLMECWWNELKEKSHRDQLSFNYASWKNQDVKFVYMDKLLYKSKWFKWCGKHKPKKTVVINKSKPSVNVKPTEKKEAKTRPARITRKKALMVIRKFLKN